MIFPAKFWSGIVIFRLLHSDGDNILTEDKAVALASFLFVFPRDFGRLIVEEIRYRVQKLATSLPFTYLVITLCKKDEVLILAGIDVEIVATKKFDFEKMQDEAQLDMWMHKLVPQVFGPVAQSGGETGERPPTSIGTTTPTHTQSALELRGK